VDLAVGERLPLTRRVPWRVLLAAPPVVFLALFFAWPVVAIVARGLRPGGQLDLGVFGEVLGDPTIRRVAWFTLWESMLSTLLCLLLGLPGAAAFARHSFRGRRTLWALLLVPFVMPTVVVATAFTALIGPDGITGVHLTGTIWAILIAHVFFNYAVVVRTVGAAWMTLDDRQLEAARTLGASPGRAFLSVTLPQLRASIASAASIVFLFSFTSFGIVVLLGGVRQRTLEVEIYDQTARFLHLDVAAVLAIVQLVGVVLLLLVFGRIRSRQDGTIEQRRSHELLRPPSTTPQRWFLAANLAVMGGLLAAPLVLLAIRSFDTSKGWGLSAYTGLTRARAGTTAFIAPFEAIINSLRFATATMVIATLLGTCAAWALAGRTRRPGPAQGSWGRSVTEVALMVPLGASAVTVGFGCLIALDRPPLELRSSLWMLPIAHSVIALPFVVRLLVPAIDAIDRRLLEAGASLGASRRRLWWSIELPLVWRQLLVAAGFAFAVSLGEFGATAFLVRSDDPTLPIAIARSLGRPGGDNFSQALALSVILMVVVAAVVLVIDRLRPLGSSEF
jgi:thiamine transport system permease protein